MADPGSSLYSRRVANEWRDVCELASCNTAVIRLHGRGSDGDSSTFTITLLGVEGLLADAGRLSIATEHTAVLHFPRFYPAVPIEAYLKRPVFHPNVDPHNGFVCLWDRFSPGDTAVTALDRLQQIIRWRLWNGGADHVMQPDAIAWHASGSDGYRLPLAYRPLVLPTEMERPANRPLLRRRLG